jgi:hypothetical protein
VRSSRPCRRSTCRSRSRASTSRCWSRWCLDGPRTRCRTGRGGTGAPCSRPCR